MGKTKKEEGHKKAAELCTAGCRESRKKWTVGHTMFRVAGLKWCENEFAF